MQLPELICVCAPHDLIQESVKYRRRTILVQAVRRADLKITQVSRLKSIIFRSGEDSGISAMSVAVKVIALTVPDNFCEGFLHANRNWSEHDLKAGNLPGYPSYVKFFELIWRRRSCLLVPTHHFVVEPSSLK